MEPKLEHPYKLERSDNLLELHLHRIHTILCSVGASFAFEATKGKKSETRGGKQSNLTLVMDAE